MAGKRKSKKGPKAHSKTISNLNLNEIKENTPPNKGNNEVSSKTDTGKAKIQPTLTNSIKINEERVLNLDNFKDWIEELKDEDVTIASKGEIEIIRHNLLDIQNNLAYIAKFLDKDFKCDLKDVDTLMKRCMMFKKLQLGPDYFSKGPLRSDFIQNRIMALKMFSEAKSTFEFLMAFQMFNLNANILSIQEQMILNKSGYLVTCEMIKDASNKLVNASDQIEKLTKLKQLNLEPIFSKLKSFEDYSKELESSLEGWIEDFQRTFHSNQIKWNSLFDKMAIKIQEHDESLDKTFGLIRKVNSRIQGLHDKFIKNQPPPDNISEALSQANKSVKIDNKSKPSDSYEELEDSEVVGESESENNEEEDEEIED